MQASNHVIVSPFFLGQPLSELLTAFPDAAAINAPVLTGREEPDRMATYHQSLADMVFRTLQADARPVSVCGDCCATIPVFAGLQRAGIFPTLVWFDAHGDFNTRETSPSGFLGGMPLAMVVGRGEQTLLQAVGLDPVEENRVFLCNARDLDTEEARQLRSSAVHHIRDFSTLFGALPADGPLYVHFDCDVISSDEAPAQNYPVAAGPGSRQVSGIFQRLNGTGRIVAASLSAWNPALDASGATARIVKRVFDTLTRP